MHCTNILQPACLHCIFGRGGVVIVLKRETRQSGVEGGEGRKKEGELVIGG